MQADLPKDRAARRVEIRKKPSPDTVAQMPFPLKDWKNEQKRLEKRKGKNPHKYISSVDDIKSASLTWIDKYVEIYDLIKEAINDDRVIELNNSFSRLDSSFI